MALDCYQPFVFDVKGQKFAWCGVGVCDPQLIANVNAVQGFVYQHGMFNWTIDGGEGGSNDIILEKGSTINFFTTGQLQLIPGGWWNQTVSDTNLLQKKDGAPVDNNFVFISRGIMVDVPEPFAKFEDTDDSDRFFPSFLQNSDDGAGYCFLMQKAVLNYTALKFSQSDNGQFFNMGLLKHSPGWVGASGSQTVRNGMISGPWFVPFSVAVCFGSPNDIRQINIDAIFGQGYRIESNDSQAVSSVTDDILYQPIELTVVGNICYVPDIMACLPCSPNKETLAARGLDVPSSYAPHCAP